MTDTAPRPLRLLLDTADTDQWERWLPTGILGGVTTNPLLLERAGLPCNLETLGELAARATALGAGEIHVQTWGEDTDAMVRRGRELARLQSSGLRVLVKVPATEAGLRAAALLQEEDCALTLTAVFNRGQVMAAAALGAAYAAPYLGRMLDDGRNGMAEITAMQEILRRTASGTRLLTASLRTAAQVGELAARGVDTFTVAPRILAELLHDELTLKAAADFNRAAAEI